jgi:MFS family permease
MPNSLAILGETFIGEERGRAIGIWAASGAAIGAIGPVLGGWLIDSVGWRTIFLLNLPLAGAAIALAYLFVPDSRADTKRPPLDLLGAVLATLGLGALTWGLTIGSGRSGWTTEAVIALAAGLMSLIAFVLVERARKLRAMMPLSLFLSQTFVGLTLLTFFLYGALGGLIVLLPYALITGADYSATAAGAALLPLPLVMAALSPVTGALAARVGPHLPLTIGPLFVAAGFGLLTQMDTSGSYWAIVLPAMILVALGISLSAAPLTTAVLASVDATHQGSASGFNSAVARIGGLVATALLGSALSASGEALLAEVHAAALAGAVVALIASLSAFAFVAARDH